MESYDSLVKALLEVSNWIVAVASESSFAHDELNAFHHADTIRDAAAAIEELQSEQKKSVTQIFCEEQAAWEGRCKDLMKQISELQAEVKRLEPKRGKWVHLYKNNFRCSLCGSWFVFEDENNPYEDGRFCSYCGAKMEVQDGSSR